MLSVGYWSFQKVGYVPLRTPFALLFFKKINENFVGTLETVRNRDVSVPRRSTVFLTGERKPIDTNNLLNWVFIFPF